MATDPSTGSSTLFDVIGSLEKPIGSSAFLDLISIHKPSGSSVFLDIAANIGVSAGNIPLRQIIVDAPFPLRVYLVSELPGPARFVNGNFVFVSDEAGGSIPAFSDGTNWRRVTDRAIVS